MNTRVQHVVNTEKTTEIPKLHFSDQVVDVPVLSVVQVPHVLVVEKTAEIPQSLSDVQVPHVQVEDSSDPTVAIR